MLTEQQVNNIHKLSDEDALQVLREIIEKLGIVSQVDYMSITGFNYTRTELNRRMDLGKIKYVKIGGVKYPLINV